MGVLDHGRSPLLERVAGRAWTASSGCGRPRSSLAGQMAGGFAAPDVRHFADRKSCKSNRGSKLLQLRKLVRGRGPLSRRGVLTYLLRRRRAWNNETTCGTEASPLSATSSRETPPALAHLRNHSTCSRSASAISWPCRRVPSAAGVSRVILPIKSPAASGECAMKPSPSRSHTGRRPFSTSRHTHEYSLCSETYGNSSSTAIAAPLSTLLAE